MTQGSHNYASHRKRTSPHRKLAILTTVLRTSTEGPHLHFLSGNAHAAPEPNGAVTCPAPYTIQSKVSHSVAVVGQTALEAAPRRARTSQWDSRGGRKLLRFTTGLTTQQMCSDHTTTEKSTLTTA
ncbi:hypothetical protein TcWFU_008990 [Taenia crassiceps]|uniref:Uncharacterized protein n=1 Tax=Taenia crassiceps TaxID=6207 RepID=A0ABR4QSP0_9CEST